MKELLKFFNHSLLIYCSREKKKNQKQLCCPDGDSWRKFIVQTWPYLQKEGNIFYSKPLLWGMQTLLGTKQPLAELVALSQKRGRVSPGQNSRTCRAHCGVLPHWASPGEALVVKPQGSLTNTEERLMCHGMTAKLPLPCPTPFFAQPYLAMLMEIFSFLKSLLKKRYFHSSAKVVLVAMDNPWLSQEYGQKQLIFTSPYLEILNTGLALGETNIRKPNRKRSPKGRNET